MSAKMPEDKPWPETNAAAADFISRLFATEDEREPATDAKLDTRVAAMERSLNRLKEQIASSGWCTVSGNNGVNPLVPLIRDARDSIDVTVLVPESLAEALAPSTPGASSAGMSLSGRLSLVKIGPSQPVPDRRPGRRSAESLPTLAAESKPLTTLAAESDSDKAPDDGYPLVHDDGSVFEIRSTDEEAACAELTFELHVPDFPETVSILHAEVAALIANAAASDLAGMPAAERRSVINVERSAVLTTRRLSTDRLEITTSREELGDLVTSETAAFGLVCAQEGGGWNE